MPNSLAKVREDGRRAPAASLPDRISERIRR
jgi:hypothetical protein